jgi:hypothetical protein
MRITLAIVEDLDEVREGLNNFLALNPDFKVYPDPVYDVHRI